MSQSATTDSTSSIATRAGGLVVLFGAMIFWAPIVFTGFGWIILSNVLAGAVIASVAALLVAKRPAGLGPYVAGSAVVVLLGAWIAASPFVMDVNTDYLLWANVVLGALVALFAALATVGNLRGGQGAAAA